GDWYDPGVGGHGMGDLTRGRIYRLAPKGSKYVVPKVELKSKEGLLAALGSPCLAVRYQPRSVLEQLPVDEALRTLALGITNGHGQVLLARMEWQRPGIEERTFSRRWPSEY